MEHCKNCTKCCELIMLDGITKEDIDALLKGKRLDPIYGEILQPITREEALSKNKNAVEERESYSGKGRVSFYSCPKAVGGKCTIYDRRPYMCSSYPFIRIDEQVKPESHAWLSKRQYVKREPQYSPTCTYVPTLIAVKNL